MVSVTEDSEMTQAGLMKWEPRNQGHTGKTKLLPTNTPRELPERQALLENMGNLEGGFAKTTRIEWEEHKFPRDLDYRQSVAPVFTYSLHQQDAWHIGDTKKKWLF